MSKCNTCGTPVHPTENFCSELCTNTYTTNSSANNGGSTDYYKLQSSWKDLQDVIEARNMNFAQGNILKAAFTFNVGRHGASTYERELNKVIWFAQRELDRIKE